MATLQKIPIDFEQEGHIYTNTVTGARLKGVTQTLLKRLFPNKYNDVPPHILEQAARRGSLVHEQIEIAETLQVDPESAEAQNYLRIKDEAGLKFLESEYLVSDMDNYASAIDLVFDEGEDEVSIGDIKTTYKFDRESTAWQLSIYAHWLEKQNPGIKVKHLYGFWLRGSEIAQIFELERHSAEEIEELIEADINDFPYEYTPKVPNYLAENELSLIVLKKRIIELQKEYDEIKAEVLAGMKKANDKSVDTGNVLVTYLQPTKHTSFDVSSFKMEHKNLYEKYKKETTTEEGIKITIR